MANILSSIRLEPLKPTCSAGLSYDTAAVNDDTLIPTVAVTLSVPDDPAGDLHRTALADVHHDAWHAVDPAPALPEAILITSMLDPANAMRPPPPVGKLVTSLGIQKKYMHVAYELRSELDAIHLLIHSPHVPLHVALNPGSDNDALNS